jgi:amino acid adenylation domain-containing protein
MNLPPEQESIRAKCFHPSGTFTEFPKEDIATSIPQRFEQLVRQYPTRLAAKIGDSAFTYDGLNRASNRLAWSIIQQCGKKNEAVGIVLAQSSAAIIAIVGVLKAGKIIVEIDASFPPERMRAILEDSQPIAIVTDNAQLTQVRRVAAAVQTIINIDDLGDSLSLENPKLPLSPQDAAQIIYTSGSTGTPKGILRDHRSRLDQIRWKINTAHVSHEDRCVALHSVSSSGFFLELFRALLSGASSFPFDVKRQGMDQLAALLVQEEITIYRSLSSTFRTFVQTLSEKDYFPHLRLVHVSGEPLNRHDVELFKEHFTPRCVMLNHFGASEGGEICNYFIDHQTEIPGNIVPVGFPVGDKEVVLVDAEGQEVGIDEVGEIIVKSRYLSQGYWRNSELTGRRFISDPKEEKIQSYLTGDLGRMLPDGCLVHIGRKDSQVKIRGYRIELAEIEAALMEHPAVKESVVTAWENNFGDKYLMAYVICTLETVPTVTELFRFLKGRLPDPMIPSGITFLESFPLTNGKIDRRSLPRHEPTRPRLERAYAPAQDGVQQNLVRIWEEVLDVRPIGIHDNFFDLGGHSLSATRVVSRVVKKFQLQIPLQSLFQSPTIADMAAVITAHQGKTLDEQSLTKLLEDLELLSDEEAQRLVEEQQQNSKV